MKPVARPLKPTFIPMPKLLVLTLVASCAAHSNLIYPKPRNAIDSLLPE